MESKKLFLETKSFTNTSVTMIAFQEAVYHNQTMTVPEL
jgi:hypothetical protein